MASTWMLRRVAVVRTDFPEELSPSIIKVKRISELGTPILLSLVMEALSSSETSVLTRATRRNVPVDAILHSHWRENLKSYKLCNINGSLLTPSFIGLYVLM
jgi:hypothetical protein